MARSLRRIGRLSRVPAKIQDGAFVAAVVACSAALYLRGLGFYSDDWGFLQLLASGDDQSLAGLGERLWDADPVLRQRPVQVAYLAASYKAFGLAPLGYHVVNTAALCGAALLLYLVARELAQPRVSAVSVACVYALLPHYSTDRFWIAAHQATLSVLFLLASTWAGLRMLRAGRTAPMWATGSVVAAIASGLAYEVTVPLCAVALATVAYRAWPLGELDRQHKRLVAAYLAAGGLALAAVVAFKARVSVRIGTDQPLWAYAADLVVGTTRVDVGVYGVGLPYVLAWIVDRAADLTVLAVGALVGLAVMLYLLRLDDAPRASRPDGIRVALRMIALGAALAAAGYAVFVVPTALSFSSSSLGNRIRIGAALGIALMFVGVCQLIASALRRRSTFAVAVGTLCGTGFIVTNTLGHFWIDAYEEQRAIVDRLQADVPSLPAHAFVLLDGVCLERGGAYVFTGRRDVRGALAIAYGDESLRASAVTNPVQIRNDGLAVRTYGPAVVFPYSNRLLVYDARRGRVTRVPSRAAAVRYFDRTAFDPTSECPPGFAWRGPAPAAS